MQGDTPFFERLNLRRQTIDSLLCVGLDPHIEDLSTPTAASAMEFCLSLIDATQDIALAYKPNIAFFEALGGEGLCALKEIIAAISDNIPVILDAKRGDIGSTARAYAQAAFEYLGADGITLSPYLGPESITPFKGDNKGIFLLCRTSNPGANTLQGKELLTGQRLFESIAHEALTWGEPHSLGFVVGATDPGALAQVRRLAPDHWILAPGVGAQGGDLPLVVQAGIRDDGSGLVVPISRGISRAADPRAAALSFRDMLREAQRPPSHGPRSSVPSAPATPSPLPPQLHPLADGLIEAGCIRFGTFTLKSGLISPIYIDLRRLVAFPWLMSLAAQGLLSLLKGLTFDQLAPLPYAGLPIGSAVSLLGDLPLVYPRKEAKAYGTKASVEGVFEPGETVVVLDDLSTTGSSKFEAFERLERAGLKVQDVVVLIDRESGAREALESAGYGFHPLFTLGALLEHWEAQGQVPSSDIAAARAFLEESP